MLIILKSANYYKYFDSFHKIIFDKIYSIQIIIFVLLIICHFYCIFDPKIVFVVDNLFKKIQIKFSLPPKNVIVLKITFKLLIKISQPLKTTLHYREQVSSKV